MYPLSTAAKITLTQSCSIDTRVTVYSPTAGVLVLPVADGSVTADATSKVRRTATITADPRYWPTTPVSLLAPYGSEATIEYGIVLPTGITEWVPLGRFRLDSASRSQPENDGITVSLVDRSAAVAEDRFDTPTQTLAGATVVSEITRLIQRTWPGVTVTDLTGSTTVAPVIDLDQDPWGDGIEQLASAIAAEVYFAVDGSAVIRPQPAMTDQQAWQVATGASGVILTAKDTLSRAGVYNRVVASGARADGTAPVYAAVADTNPLSPTYYGGPFGRKPRRYSSPLLTTVGQCTAAATALLARATGAGVQVELESMVNPALEPGDVIAVTRDGVTTTHILDKVTIPLSPAGTQPLGTRSNDLPPES